MKYNDSEFQQHVREKSKTKYVTDTVFKQHVREQIQKRYANEPDLKGKLCELTLQKYHNDEAFREAVKSKKNISVLQNKSRGNLTGLVLFKIFVKQSSVVQNMSAVVAALALGPALAFKNKVLIYMYVYKSYGKNCIFQDEASSKLWICYTCDKHLLKGKLPVETKCC